MRTTATIRRVQIVNRFPGKRCAHCSQPVERFDGIAASPLTAGGKWDVYCADHAHLAGEASVRPVTDPMPAAVPAHPAPVAPVMSSLEVDKLVREAIAGAKVDQALVARLSDDVYTRLADKVASLTEQLINERLPQQIEIKVNGTAPVTIDGPAHAILPRLIQLLAAGQRVWLPGPAGCGKTTIAAQAAKALGLEFYFTGAVASPYDLIGYLDAEGNYHETQFYKAVSAGGLFLFDEIDASDARACLRFNAVLSGHWGDFPTGKVEIHPDCRFVAAANTFGTGADQLYVGRNQLDAATLDRFYYLPMDYDPSLERHLANGNGAWCEYVQQVRDAVRKLAIRHVVSTRAVIEGGKLLTAGIDRADVEAGLLWRGLPADQVGKIKKAVS